VERTRSADLSGPRRSRVPQPWERRRSISGLSRAIAA
jgi:hypothetical protein